MGTQCESGYTSHYTLVTKKKAARNICSSKRDYEHVEGLTNFFPVLANEVPFFNHIFITFSSFFNFIVSYILVIGYTRGRNSNF